VTPTVVSRLTVLAAETRSYMRAEKAARDGAGLPVSAKLIKRLVHDVGVELAQRRDGKGFQQPLARRAEEPPQLVVVEWDGGRIRTGQPGHGPGGHLEGESCCEAKNAVVVRATRQVFEEDPQPEPPACFSDPQHVAEIVGGEQLAAAESSLPAQRPDEEEQQPRQQKQADWRPKRLVRTVLSSEADSKPFGRQMAREAKQRRFYEALCRAFLGDGQAWNWSIWKQYFPTFTPILDFIHVLSYLYAVASAVHSKVEDAWENTACGCEAVGKGRWIRCCTS
jgi:hypothetical protein